MSIIHRVEALNLPPEEFVVIGSGILDALRLRESGDVDLVISPDLFAMLQNDDSWNVGEKRGEPIVTKGDTEAFLSWGSVGRVPNFRELYDAGVAIEGIRFANPHFVMRWKQGRGMQKDLRDIALLEEYLKTHPL